MPSIQVRSLSRYLLVGLVILFLASGSEALPTHAKHGASTPPANKRPTVGKNSPHAKQDSARSCPLPAPRSRLHKRTLSHPSGKEATVLFHGTNTPENAEAMQAKVDLSKTSSVGDLHFKKRVGGTCNGGLYLTDSVIAAAQFACYNKRAQTAYVLEYDWDPKSHNVYEFAPTDTLSRAMCQQYDMVTGPMNKPVSDDDLTPSFWQYAIVNQATATDGLKYVTTHTIPCKKETGRDNVPRSNALTDDVYSLGQRANPGFDGLLTSLTTGTFCIA